MRLNSKDTQHWTGSVTKWLEAGTEQQRQWRESSDRVKFVTKLEIVYDFLEKQKQWAYSMDELIGIFGMTRNTVKHVIKILEKIGAVELKIAADVKYYIFKQDMDVLKVYKKALVKKYRSWRIDSEEIAKDMERKGLGHVGENSSA